ncbi:scavenger receptor cysteine-rich domain-containing protein SCART1-like [Tachyglossus aculeatus]|uniref:scavenger receptor cysteine-rich domain-containing protein SCART1-like n=1 Tax=Tachyglossus aculeatus TaxID=9261 RepID=UPI0018F5BC21|nr:scavenger receptor cysteine-rich domain-containing protein SCART1-like [Tachyglossus aculeatus]
MKMLISQLQKIKAVRSRSRVVGEKSCLCIITRYDDFYFTVSCLISQGVRDLQSVLASAGGLTEERWRIWFGESFSMSLESLLPSFSYYSMMEGSPPKYKTSDNFIKGCVEEVVKLYSSEGPCSGIVLVNHQDQWGLVCSHSWDMEEAAVVCKHLNCGTALAAPKFSPVIQYYQDLSNAPWLHGVSCKGNESSFRNCNQGDWSWKDCSHDWFNCVLCTESVYSKAMLVKGNSPCAGFLGQIMSSEHLRITCGFWSKEATVLCRELGCGSALQPSKDAHLREDLGNTSKAVTCQGTEPTILNCLFQQTLLDSCDLDSASEVICSGHREVRLVGGEHPCAGRLEVRRGLEWGTICQSDLDLATAHVVCRELSCGAAVSTPGGAGFGRGQGPQWTQETFRCRGNESLLFHCPRGPARTKPCSHRQDAAVRCSEYRLVNGSSRCEGRVELQVGGSWGPLCAAHWDLADAHVLCHQLGCGVALATAGGVFFGSGDGPAWTDAFHCTGTEPHLWNCPRSALGASSCPPHHVANAICSGESAEVLRLQGGQSRCDGRVEIFLRGAWGRIVAEAWGLVEAGVVCRQLHCGEAHRAYSLDQMACGPEATPVGLSAVTCAGNETRLTQCQVSITPPSPAGMAWDVGVVCSESEGLRLAGGPGRCAGRVEVLHDGHWGTVCDDSWDLADAQVVCRQLSCGMALGAPAPTGYGAGTGPIWLDELACTGNESRLWQCPSAGWGQHNCRHKEDVGVLCSEFIDMRLAGGSWACTGRLEVFYNGTWGSVCHNSLTGVSLTVICKQLQCGARGQLLDTPEPDAESRLTWVDHIECREKHHTSLWQCPSSPWHPHSCPRTEEAWISCQEERDEKNESPEETLKCSVFNNCTAQEKVRVRGGEDGCSGRVEVWHVGSWGTVCDDAWDLADAHVVCRQLGCGAALAAPGRAAFGPGTGTIWLDEVRCQGSEASLWDCPAAPWGRTDCDHKEDAAVNCSGQCW